jgi:hypothetical protein
LGVATCAHTVAHAPPQIVTISRPAVTEPAVRVEIGACTESDAGGDAAVPASGDAPWVEVGAPVTGGLVDAAAVRAAVEARREALDLCQRKGLIERAAAGAIEARVTIDASGRAAEVKVSGDRALGACVAGVLGAVTFPRPTARGEVTIPLALHAAGESTATYLTDDAPRALATRGPQIGACWAPRRASDPLASEVETIEVQVGIDGSCPVARGTDACVTDGLRGVSLPRPAAAMHLTCPIRLGPPDGMWTLDQLADAIVVKVPGSAPAIPSGKRALVQIDAKASAGAAWRAVAAASSAGSAFVAIAGKPAPVLPSVGLRPVASILVGADAAVLGAPGGLRASSRGDDLDPIVAGLKKMGGDRTDVEIGFEDDVPAPRMAKVLEAVAAAGFYHVAFVAPGALRTPLLD